jgi:hypothetical protein
LSEAGGSTPVPEAWIGRTVELIFISGSSTEYADGDLEEVNERGIVLSVETQVGRPARPPVLSLERRHSTLRGTGLMRKVTRRAP